MERKVPSHRATTKVPAAPPPKPASPPMARHKVEVPPWRDGKIKAPPESLGYDIHIGYDNERHLAAMINDELKLVYRRKVLSDGEARRYLIGWVQIAYARIYSDTPAPGWLVCVVGSDPQKGKLCKNDAAIITFLIGELKGEQA